VSHEKTRLTRRQALRVHRLFQVFAIDEMSLGDSSWQLYGGSVSTRPHPLFDSPDACHLLQQCRLALSDGAEGQQEMKQAKSLGLAFMARPA
jgi:hypothetical protein